MKILQYVWFIYLRVTARFPALRSIVPFIPLLIAGRLLLNWLYSRAYFFQGLSTLLMHLAHSPTKAY